MKYTLLLILPLNLTCRSVLNTYHALHIYNLQMSKCLGHDVSRHQHGRQVVDIYDSSFYHIVQPVVVQVQVLHVSMVFRILCYSKCRLVFNIEG